MLLENGPLTSGEISKELGINPIAGYRCLAYMRDDLRQIHSIPANNRRKMNQWAIGPDASLKSKDAALDQSFAERRFTVPARQIGMVRDALVAALFGAPHSN